MDGNRLRLIYTVILIFGLNSCQQSDLPSHSIESIDQLSSVSEIQLPPEAKILIKHESERGANFKYVNRIIFSKTPFSRPNVDIFTMKSNESHEIIRSYLGKQDIGNPEESVQFANWTNTNGDWRGIWSETSLGYYLNLEQFTAKDG